MKINKITNLKSKLSKLAIASALVIGTVAAPAAVFADTNSANTTINANIGSTIY